jgi:PAS domain S-box-containing protein
LSVVVILVMTALLVPAGIVIAVQRSKLKRLGSVERELENSEQRFHLALRTARIGSWEWDVKNNVLAVSPTYYSMLGYQPKPGPADRSEWIERTHPEDRAMVLRKMREVTDGESDSYEYEARIRSVEGAYRWQRVTGFIVERDPDGRVSRIIGIRKDINDRKQAEAALQKNEKRLRSIFEDSPIPIWEEDFSGIKKRLDEARLAGVQDWEALLAPRERVIELASLLKILDVNRATVKLLECDDKEGVFRALPGCMDEPSVDVFRAEFLALVSGKSGFECESMLRTAKGTQVFLQLKLHIVPGYEETWGRVLVSMVDLSGRKAAERALEESEAKYRGLVEQSSDGILLIDAAGTVLDCNQVFEALAGADKGRIVGRKVWEPAPSLMPAPLRSAEGIGPLAVRWKAGADAPVQHFESALREDSGVERIIEHALYPIFHKGDLLIGDIMRDVTEQRQASDALRSSLREKELLLSEIHHRVKNNLQIICSLINLQIGKSGDSRADGSGLQDMENRVRSMAFVHELLYQSDEFAAIDFAAYVRQLSDYLLQAYEAAAARVRLDLTLDQVPIPIDKAIPCGLIINELISNALKHAFPAGRSGTIRVRLSKEADESVALTVQDDGVGLPAGGAGAAGEKRGIGMTLVESLTGQLRGSLEIRSDGGLLVRVVFPV